MASNSRQKSNYSASSKRQSRTRKSPSRTGVRGNPRTTRANRGVALGANRGTNRGGRAVRDVRGVRVLHTSKADRANQSDYRSGQLQSGNLRSGNYRSGGLQSGGFQSGSFQSGRVASAQLRGESANISGRISGNLSQSSRLSEAGLESRTIGEIRRGAAASARASANDRVAKSRRLPITIIVVIAIIIIVALAALFVLSKTNAFEITNIDVQGAEHLTNDEISALVSIPSGTTLLNVDAESISKSLERDSWVDSVDVNRIFPNTLEIVVHERDIGAIVEIPMGNSQTIQSWAIANDGTWLMAIPDKTSEIGSQISETIYEDADAALHITDVPYGLQPEIGKTCDDDNVNNALSIISGMTTELADRVKVVSAKDAVSTLLTLDNNIEIAFGSADNIREKERVCLELMEDEPNIVYINVRVVERPTYRAA